MDRSKYPPDWESRIIPALRDRSGNKCEGDSVTGFDGAGRCGVPNGAYITRLSSAPAAWFFYTPDDERQIYERRISSPIRVVLTAAHLDRDPENHAVDLDRLRYLCQRCHLRYDKAANAEKRAATLQERRAATEAASNQGYLFEEGP